MKRNLVVLGGGTAGWLTALIVKRFYPNCNITLVESTEIGVLGAGEGTVPHFIDVLDFIGIPVSDLVKRCSSTLKIGIKFTNWNGDGTSFFHSFAPNKWLNFEACDGGMFQDVMPTKQIGDNKPLDDINFSKKLAEQFKVPFTYSTVAGQNPIMNFARYGNFAVHFNARKLAAYLKEVALFRGVGHVDGKLKTVNGSPDITSLTLEDGTEVMCDFVFDCSGFARLLIGKHFGSEWQSYKEHLPLDTGVPFFIPHDNTNLAPQTESIAMKYGWIWKIPVKDRYGCGYVFDSSYINEKEALAEAEEYFGMKLESPTTFKFNAGTYKEVYKQNCLAIGLSQGFIEPLEATSIWVSAINLIMFLQSDGVNNTSDEFRSAFNKECYDRNHEVVEFIYLHYLTERKDSPFWEEFRTKTKMVPSLKAKLDRWNKVPVTQFELQSTLWSTLSWFQVGDGCRVFDRSIFKNKSDNLFVPQDIGRGWQNALSSQENVLKSCITHEEFLKELSK